MFWGLPCLKVGAVEVRPNVDTGSHMDKVWTPPEGMSPSFTNQMMWRLQCHCQHLHRQRLTQGSGQQYLSSLPSVEAGWEGGPTKPIWSHSHTRSMNQRKITRLTKGVGGFHWPSQQLSSETRINRRRLSRLTHIHKRKREI